MYGQQKLDQKALGGLIDLIGSITLGDAEAQDVLGRVYEYFLGQFALAEGKKGGQFYTPESIVKLLVEMLEPYNGRVFDPCCGSGSYRDIKGFCKSASIAEIEKHNFVLTPGRYVGIPDEVEDGVSFEEKMGALTADLAAQMNEGLALEAEIKIQLAKVGFSLEVD